MTAPRGSRVYPCSHGRTKGCKVCDQGFYSGGIIPKEGVPALLNSDYVLTAEQVKHLGFDVTPYLEED